MEQASLASRRKESGSRADARRCRTSPAAPASHVRPVTSAQWNLAAVAGHSRDLTRIRCPDNRRAYDGRRRFRRDLRSERNPFSGSSRRPMRTRSFADRRLSLSDRLLSPGALRSAAAWSRLSRSVIPTLTYLSSTAPGSLLMPPHPLPSRFGTLTPKGLRPAVRPGTRA